MIIYFDIFKSSSIDYPLFIYLSMNLNYFDTSIYIGIFNIYRSNSTYIIL